MSEVWYIEHKEKSDTWLTCRFVDMDMPGVPSMANKTWDTKLDDGRIVTIVLYCREPARHREDVRQLMHAMKTYSDADTYVTYRRVTVDLRR